MLEDIRSAKIEKLKKLQEAGLDPYPVESQKDYTNADVLENFDDLSDKEVALVGRIRSMRQMGALIFVHVEDESGRIQFLIKKDIIGDDSFKLFADNIDLGDFIQGTGTLFKTKTDEKTLQVSSWKILSKSLLPLPSEFYGLKDKEELLRKRYLDLALNYETRELFKKKSIFWKTIREVLNAEDFLEVDTPVLESIPGGADARPFITHHNALDRDFYMRISLELPLKRLLVGGYEKVYEIGRVFRNEGIDAEHLQDYLAMEFYWAYGDMKKGMELVERMYKQVIKNVTGGYETVYDGQTINWGGKWPTVNYFDEFKKETGIDLNDDISVKELRAKADELGIKYENSYGKGKMIDTIYKKTVRQKLVQPCFLVDQPIDIEPLAKKDPSNPKKVLRFQVVAVKSELGKGFSELNDPLDQRQRFEEQAKLRKAGDDEAQMIDEDFIEAMEYGMPPAAGFGLSERLFSVLMDRPIRETTIYPHMREGTETNNGKSKETKIAIAVINKSAGLKEWQELNTVSHLSASFAARIGKSLFTQDKIETKDDEGLKLNIQHAIFLKESKSNEDLRNLVIKAEEAGFEVVSFTREMLDFTDDKKVAEETRKKNFDEIEILGVLVFGKKKAVEELAKKFELYQ